MTSILASKSVLASLNLSRWNGHRIDKRITNQVNSDNAAEADAGRYNKKLLSTEAMAPILAAVTAARNYHWDKTLPWFDEGARLLPSKLFLEYTAQMQEYRIAFEAAVELFVKTFPDHVEAAKARLGKMFDPADYPAASELRTLFGFDVVILPCPDTDDFRIAVGADHVEDIRRDLEERMKKAMVEASRDAMERAAEAIGRMIERLRAYKPGEQGARATGTFRDSLVENVREIARLLPAFNLGDDLRMTSITERIERDLCTHDANALRDGEHTRNDVADKAEQILSDMSKVFG